MAPLSRGHTRTQTSHYHVQKRRRAQFLADWRRHRQTVVHGSDVPLADPLQQIWDLQDLGGADRLEAAGRLRQWLLARP